MANYNAIDAADATITFGATDTGSFLLPFHRHTDATGTNFMPTMDAAARRGFVTVTDATNTMPTMDAVARAGFVKVTDGTDTALVTTAGELNVLDSANKVDDAAFTPATSYVCVIGGQADEAATDSVDEGDAGALRMTLARKLIIANHFLDDAAFTPGTDYVGSTGFLADETATDSVDEGDVGIGRMTLDRKQIVTDLPHTAGGLSTSHTVSAASTNATNVKNAAGQIYLITANNLNAAARYLKIYNTAAAPTVGTDTPVMVIALPPAGSIVVPIDKGLALGTGISFALTSGIANSDTGAVSASEHAVFIGYK